MGADLLVVPRRTFAIDEPWEIAAGSDPVRLRSALDGSAPRLATTVSASYDDEALTVVFCTADDHVVATMHRHDDPLYEEDVVEVFVAPETLIEYYEFEVSPIGATFDARIESPDGVRATMRADVAWNGAGLFAAVRTIHQTNGALSTDTVLRIPFAALGRGVPEDGEEWRANFFRIDRHPDGDEYSAWQPTLKVPADFHVAAAFGRLRFQA